MLFLHIHTQFSEQLGSYTKVVDPGDVTDKIFAHDLWDFIQLHGLTQLFQFFIDDPEVVSKQFEPFISAHKSRKSLFDVAEQKGAIHCLLSFLFEKLVCNPVHESCYKFDLVQAKKGIV